MVYNRNKGSEVSMKSAIVVDGQWSLVADDPPAVGNTCSAIATKILDGPQPGPVS